MKRAQHPRPALPIRLAQAHAQALVFTAGKLARNPLASLLTAAVIGITLALPAGLHVLMNNLDGLRYGWERSTQAALFLKDEISESSGRELARRLDTRPDIAEARYISAEQGWQEFRAVSGFGEALDLLQDNPLPAVISVQPASGLQTDSMTKLFAELAALPEVGMARMDQAWLQRLQALLDIARRLTLGLTGLFALAVIFAVGNTIRLEIYNRRDEIEVMKLLGASNAFVHRPFLYLGLWYGLIGGLVAALLVQALLWLLHTPVRQLAGLYESDFVLSGLGPLSTLLLIGGSILLGVAGSILTVRRHLQAILPE